MFKKLFSILVLSLIVVSTLSAVAQTSNQFVAAAPVAFPQGFGTEFLVVSLYLTLLGLLQQAVHKIPGAVGKVLSFIVDTISANVKHK